MSIGRLFRSAKPTLLPVVPECRRTAGFRLARRPQPQTEAAILASRKPWEARTGARAANPDLAGRTYAIPFVRVWDSAVQLADGGLQGWQIMRWDDREGVVEAEAKGSWPARLVRVKIRVALDVNAQTRVDAVARAPLRGFGAGSRRIKSFFRALDRDLAVRPEQVLAPWPPRIRAH